MNYPIFNIPYKEAYTSCIEFQTQINEKMKGREQRYPVWTYPKRTFTLKFDKNFKGRKRLEDFFIQVMGQGQQFEFVWEKSKGGNDKTYLCSFDSDSFKQNINDYGFSESELKLVCIDDTQVEQVGELDFYHRADSEAYIEFYTIVDKIFTARNERTSYWELPKKSWTLTFEKNAVNRKKLEEFFIAKRGRFRSFDWTWRKDLGGDGKTYTVRFDEDSLEELASSIRELGIIQPLTLRKVGAEHYQIISGERRFRAAKLAGLDSVPAYVRTASDSEITEMALIENIQREDLNAIEIALTFKKLIDQYELTQEQLSARIGKKRATIANFLRLLKLPAEVQLGLRDRRVDMGHARALLAVENPKMQLKLYNEIIKRGLSVRQVEELAKQYNADGQEEVKPVRRQGVSKEYELLKNHLSQSFHTQVQFTCNKQGRGKITFPFKNEQELERLITIFDRLKGNLEN